MHSLKKINFFIFFISGMLLTCSSLASGPQGGSTAPDRMIMACDFDSKSLQLHSYNCTSTLAYNPFGSDRCACVTLKGGSDDCVVFTLDRCLDFSKSPAVVRFRVISPRPGLRIDIKLAPEKSGRVEPVFGSVTTTLGGAWEELVFDFSDKDLPSNWFRKLFIYPNRGKDTKTVGEKWYIDDIRVPDDDISEYSLFRRPEPQYPPKPDKSHFWISNSTANPEVVPPSRSVDGNWWLFMRGGDGKVSRLGVYTQKAENFKPLGPWDYYEGNPVIDYNIDGTVDNRGVIDPAPVVADDGSLYLFYKGQGKVVEGSLNSPSTVLYARSADGFHYEDPVIWRKGIGIGHMVRGLDGKYYLLVARRIYAFDDPEADSMEAVEYKDIISKEGGPANFDRYSINGGKLIRLEGVDKWFLFYQGSSMHDDFPDRFHVAMSDDLINWTKVDNKRPLFTRGHRGTWDQGAIWAPSVFEYGGMLYMYYEGWGCRGKVANRDKRYFNGGHSEIGISMCSKRDFLIWCGLL